MDMIDQILGWKSVGSIGVGYGRGNELEQVREVIERISL
tara:strand:+ start:189 stop:305 length:117 start_codon:yes stop_codon:yes gene_type:complete